MNALASTSGQLALADALAAGGSKADGAILHVAAAPTPARNAMQRGALFT